MNKKVIFIFLFSLFWIISYSNATSLQFDGNDDVVVSHDSVFDISSYTIEAWIWFDQNRNYDPIFFKRSGTASEIELYGGNGFTVLHNRSNGGTCSYYYAPYAPAQEWAHIAATYNASTQKSRLYYNGVLIADQTLANLHTSSFDLTFGSSQWSGNLQGKMDEIRFWNIERSQTEIQNTMHTTLTGNENGLIGYWPIMEETGTTVQDLANDNDGIASSDQNWLVAQALDDPSPVPEASPVILLSLTLLTYLGIKCPRL